MIKFRVVRFLTSIICILTIFGSIFLKINLCISDSNMPRWYIFIIGLCVLLIDISIAYLMKIRVLQHDFLKSISYWIVMACFLQSVLFLLQTLYIIPKENIFCAGSFDNKSGLAACLAVSIPVGMRKVFSYDKNSQKAFFVFKAITLIVLLLIKSRLGIICIIVTALFFIRAKCIATYLLSLISFFAVTFLMKTDSSKGRFFIYERTVEMINKYPLTGWGYKGFEKKYMSFQADYLSNNKNTPYANLVDNIHHPMCEFLQVGVDWGVFGLCCLCVVISVIYCKLRKLQDDGEATTCFVVVLIYSMFSYSLHFPFTWIVIAYSIVPTIKLTKKLRLPICIISSIFSFIILICTIKEIHSDYKWWHLAQKTFFAVSTKDLKEYKTLYLEKNKSPYFLFNYSAVLYRIGNYEKAYEMAKKCFDVFNDYEVCLYIGSICEKLYNYEESLYWYKLAHNMIPSRIVPLYREFCIYRDLNNTYKAIDMANKITLFNPKVINTKVENIKYDVANYLKQCKK